MRDGTRTPVQGIVSRGSSSKSTGLSEENGNGNEEASPYQGRYRPFSYQAYPGAGVEEMQVGMGMGGPMPPEHSEPALQSGMRGSSYYYPYSHTETRYQPYRENGQGDSGAPAYDEVFGGPTQGQEQEQQQRQERQLEELLELPAGMDYSDNESGHGFEPVSPLPPSPAGNSNGSRAGSVEQGIGKPRGPR